MPGQIDLQLRLTYPRGINIIFWAADRCAINYILI